MYKSLLSLIFVVLQTPQGPAKNDCYRISLQGVWVPASYSCQPPAIMHPSCEFGCYMTYDRDMKSAWQEQCELEADANAIRKHDLKACKVTRDDCLEDSPDRLGDFACELAYATCTNNVEVTYSNTLSTIGANYTSDINTAQNNYNGCASLCCW